MSSPSWIETYYPVPAAKAAKRREDETEHDFNLRLLDHALLKWCGLSKAALAASGVGNRPISIGGETCALCITYIENQRSAAKPCEGCPLYESRGGIPCDEETDEEDEPPFNAYFHDDDPSSMLRALKVARRFVLQAARGEEAAATERLRRYKLSVAWAITINDDGRCVVLTKTAYDAVEKVRRAAAVLAHAQESEAAYNGVGRELHDATSDARLALEGAIEELIHRDVPR